MAFPLGGIVFWTVLASTPLALYLFAPERWRSGWWRSTRRLLFEYRWHWGLFILIILEKGWVDALNDPVRGVFGDYTWLIYQVEGNLTYWIQTTFHHELLTGFLRFHYLWLYVFLNYFTVMLFAYRDDRELANLAALNYSIIYVLAVPFYVFFNVQVTGDFIPGMQRLLYDSGPGFYDFFLAHDPLDNAFPSLHIAIPFGLALVMWWTMKRRGYRLRDWEFRSYFLFLAVNTALFVFSILYLGIHWITDIPGGLLVGLLGASIAELWHREFFGLFATLEKALARGARRAWSSLRRA